MKVKKAVIAVAGYGTRFLPYTKAVPKAMLPILNKPAIQVIAEEVVNSGITDILFIVGYKKEVIEEHFLPALELEKVLLNTAKKEFYDAIKYPETFAKISFAIQTELNGTAKAVEIAKDFVGNEPFAILFGDDVMYNDGLPVIKQLVDVYERTGKSVIGCKHVELKDVPKYASVEYSSENGREYDVTVITEKPPIELVKSTLSPLGRYVVSPEIFKIIEELKPAPNGEYQLTDALSTLAKNFGMIALNFEGTRYDMGTRLGSIKANLEFGLRDPELKDDLVNYIKNLNL
ncbi:MAG: UTP--glucose-1-phosphate uridylyltransferase [Clostridia bacterium]|nr:UTP--glucose-1-phosphate uridylyltransferase [Clostridia bacterium]